MREKSIFNQIDLQTLTVFFIGMSTSIIGMVLGSALLADEKKSKKSE